MRTHPTSQATSRICTHHRLPLRRHGTRATLPSSRAREHRRRQRQPQRMASPDRPSAPYLPALQATPARFLLSSSTTAGTIIRTTIDSTNTTRRPFHRSDGATRSNPRPTPQSSPTALAVDPVTDARTEVTAAEAVAATHTLTLTLRDSAPRCYPSHRYRRHSRAVASVRRRTSRQGVLGWKGIVTGTETRCALAATSRARRGPKG